MKLASEKDSRGLPDEKSTGLIERLSQSILSA
jgi:hypothetical protein